MYQPSACNIFWTLPELRNPSPPHKSFLVPSLGEVFLVLPKPSTRETDGPGIRDGHDDNLMLRRDGRLFRVDFGFAFGRTPEIETRPEPWAFCDPKVEQVTPVFFFFKYRVSGARPTV